VLRTLVGELPDRIGQRVLLQGWVHRRRRLGAVAFLLVRDRSGVAQVVLGDGAVLDALPEETVIAVEGTVTAREQAPGGVELTSPQVTALSAPAATPPVQLWRPALDVGLPTVLDHAPVVWRHRTRQALWRIAASSVRGFRRVLDVRGFTEIHTPKLVGGATESGANVFTVDYFGRPAYLAQSPQLYKQIMVGVFERVYETGPVFRAEPHDTSRHLAEYVSLDVELGFIDDHRDVLAVLGEVLAGMLAEIAAEDVDLAGVRLPALPDSIPVVHFRDALRLVGADPAEPDLAPEHERLLGAWAQEQHRSDFLAVEGYPARKRPFYTHPEPGDPTATNSFDLLFRGQELVTGGQRLHEIADYERALAERGEPLATYAGYLDAFRHGMPPHGGFAIGLERWTAQLAQRDNIRQTTLFPRDRQRLTP
jgi:nondiscriminating aspartyl-tRNA synthetase